MTTLADLREALAREAVPPGPGADALPVLPATPVAWVRVLRARVPGLDLLEPGDLVIVPAAALAVAAPDEDARRALAGELRAGGAAGVLLAAPDTRPPGPADALAALGEAAAAVGLPALRVGGLDASTLERRVLGYLLDRRGELDRLAGALEADLARLAVAGRGLEAMAAALAGFLGRAVALEDGAGEILAVHAPEGAPTAAAAAAAYLARPAGTGRRVALPAAPGEDAPAGWLVLLGDRVASDLEAAATERVAPVLALELAVERRPGRPAGAPGGEPLPSGGPPWVVLVARQLEAPGGPSREDVRRELRARFAARRLGLRGSAESLELRAVAAPDPGDADGTGIAARVAAQLGRTVAVSRPFTAPAGRPAAEASARSTLEAAERLPEPPAVARADREAAYRLLAALGSLPDDRAQARGLLAPLLDGTPASVRERLATLRALLDTGSPGEAARVLGIHRNTLAYRQRNLQARTGWDLADGDLRLALGVAVRIVQSEQK